MTNDLAEAIQRETTFTNMAKNKFDYTIAYSKTGVSPIFRKGEYFYHLVKDKSN